MRPTGGRSSRGTIFCTASGPGAGDPRGTEGGSRCASLLMYCFETPNVRAISSCVPRSPRGKASQSRTACLIFQVSSGFRRHGQREKFSRIASRQRSVGRHREGIRAVACASFSVSLALGMSDGIFTRRSVTLEVYHTGLTGNPPGTFPNTSALTPIELRKVGHTVLGH